VIAALSPALSWLVVGVVAGFAVAVYLLASAWLDRQEYDLPPMFTYTEPANPRLRVFGGIYDAEARGDFHDPVRDHEWCADCNARLRRAFNRLGDLDLGPRDADMLMAAIRRELES